MPDDAGTGGEIVYFSSKQAEEIGFEKFAKRQAALQGIKTIVLDRMRIRCGDLEAEREVIMETCKDVMELDLGSNLLETLDEIRELVVLFPKLRGLVLDGNRFSLRGGSSGEKEQLSRITSLGLSETLLRWDEIAEVCNTFPGTTSLAAASNGLAQITSHTLPSGLRELDLAGNSFQSLSDLQHISSCAHLENMILKHNPVSQAHHAGTPPPLLNQTLRDLDLAHCSISSWSFFDTLPTSFPSLIHLRVTGNPIYNTVLSADGKPLLTAEDGYILTIARLPQLQTLNYSKITEKERLNADSYYLRQIVAEITAASPDQAAKIQASHPRWKALCEEYGEPALNYHEVAKKGDVDPRSLAARFVNVTFVSNISSSEPSLNSTTASENKTLVPSSANIYTVLGIASKFLRLSISPLELRLIWETDDDADHAVGGGGVSQYSSGTGPEWWDSSDDEEESGKKDQFVESESVRRKREVELVPGTNALGMYIEGREARVRVERR